MIQGKHDIKAVTGFTSKRLVLIIYDVVETKRRNQLIKLLESYGYRVQKSAFEALLTQRQYDEITKKIMKIIDECDNVRMYRLNSSNEIVYFGGSEPVYNQDVIIL